LIQLFTLSSVQGRPFLSFDHDDAPNDHVVESPLSRRSSMSSYRGRGRSDSVRTRRSPSRSVSPKPVCFHCGNCAEERPMSVVHPDIELCTYCMLSPPEYDHDYQLVCCHPRHHIVTHADMLDEEGKRHEICNECRELGFLSSAASLTTLPQSQSSQRPASSFKPLSSQGPQSSQFLSTDPPATPRRPSRGHAPPDPNAANGQRQAKLDAFRMHDPPLAITSEDWHDDPALTKRDYALLNNFHKKLDREQLETCLRCEEKWFHMGLNDD
jgi:hypothetical protein